MFKNQYIVEGSFIVAYVAILALINLRNIHLSDMARKMSSALLEYKLKNKYNENFSVVEEAMKDQISRFTRRYLYTGVVSLSMVVVVITFPLAAYCESKITLSISFIFFFVGVLILVFDMINGYRTLHINNSILGVDDPILKKK